MNFSFFLNSLLQGVLFVACAGAASAEMSAVGSVGIVDSADVAKIVTEGTSVTLSFAQPGPQVATIRYNVSLDLPAVADPAATRWILKIRYQDGDPPPSDTQRLLIHLKELELSTGVETTILTFDSNVMLATDPAGSESDWKVRTVCVSRNYQPDTA